MIRWGNGERVVSDFLNDFCLAHDRAGRWHHFGHLDHGATGFAHSVGNRINEPFTPLSPINPAGPPDLAWSPFVIWADDVPFMFYAHLAGGDFSLRMLEGSPDLFDWRPAELRDEGNIVCSERAARDPCVIFDDQLQAWLLYYVSQIPTEGGDVVRMRQPCDLREWFDGRTVLGTPPSYGQAESVFALKHNDFYYLWVSGTDYAVMSVYVSRSPYDFGDADLNRVMEQPGHAAEIVVLVKVKAGHSML
jgi:hypothetical protein